MLSDSLIRDIERAWTEQRDDRLRLLEDLVATNTHADNLDGIAESRARLRPAFEALGLTVDEPAPAADAPRPRGAHLVARRDVPGAPRVLLIGHLDTVFPADDPFRDWRRDGDLLHGPGVGDIKGGVVTILGALACLGEVGAGTGLSLTVFLNSDEEVGSHASRELVRTLAREADWALGFEPAFHAAGESVADHRRVQHVVRRKGCGRYTFTLEGRAAHSGGAHHLGASAVEALARKVTDVHALTDRSRGVTTNVGLVQGGRSVNTVAPHAAGEIDFRFEAADDGEATSDRIRALLEREEHVNPDLDQPVTTCVEDGGGVLWPPLVPTPASEALSQRVLDVSGRFGVTAEAIARGGASDASHAAALGVPAICGLGPVSHGIHTNEEHTSVPALAVAVHVATGLLIALSASEGATADDSGNVPAS